MNWLTKMFYRFFPKKVSLKEKMEVLLKSILCEDRHLSSFSYGELREIKDFPELQQKLFQYIERVFWSHFYCVGIHSEEILRRLFSSQEALGAIDFYYRLLPIIRDKLDQKGNIQSLQKLADLFPEEGSSYIVALRLFVMARNCERQAMFQKMLYAPARR